MTPAEEAELRALEAEEAQQAAATPAAPAERKKMEWTKAARIGAGQGLTFDWGDELGAALQGGLMAATGQGDYGPSYRQALGENRAESKQAFEDQPAAFIGGNVLGSIPSTIATGGGASKLAQALGKASPTVARIAYRAAPLLNPGEKASLLKKALAMGAKAAPYGAVSGAGVSTADTPGGVAEDAALGAGLAGTIGAALPVAGAAAGAVGRPLVNGIVRPGAVAEQLKALGVDTGRMTLGQLNPGSKLAELEELAGVTSSVREQRAQGLRAWREAAIRHGYAPNAPLEGETAPEMLFGAERSFNPAYAHARAEPIKTAGQGQLAMADQLRQQFRDVVNDPNIDAEDVRRASLGKHLNQMASMIPYKPGDQGSVGSLMDLRGKLREKLRDTAAGPNAASDREMLKRAIGDVTQQIEWNVGGHTLDALRDTDKAYWRFKVLQDGMDRARLQLEGAKPLEEALAQSSGKPVSLGGGMRPSHLEGALAGALPEGAMARGEGGVLREMAGLGKAAFEDKTPATGVRALISKIPYGEKLTSPGIALMNSGPVKKALLGETAAQQQLRALIEALRSGTPDAAKDTATALERRLLFAPSERFLFPQTSEATSQ